MLEESPVFMLLWAATGYQHVINVSIGEGEPPENLIDKALEGLQKCGAYGGSLGHKALHAEMC